MADVKQPLVADSYASPLYGGQPLNPAPMSYAPQPAAPQYYAAPQAMYTTTTMHSVPPPQHIIVQQPFFAEFGSVPQQTFCQTCNMNVVSVTEKEIGLGNWAVCGGVALIGCIFGCCLIPFCVDELKDTHHFCPNCRRKLGVKKIIKV